jgi:hypothetical protein
MFHKTNVYFLFFFLSNSSNLVNTCILWFILKNDKNHKCMNLILNLTGLNSWSCGEFIELTKAWLLRVHSCVSNDIAILTDTKLNVRLYICLLACLLLKAKYYHFSFSTIRLLQMLQIQCTTLDRSFILELSLYYSSSVRGQRANHSRFADETNRC